MFHPSSTWCDCHHVVHWSGDHDRILPHAISLVLFGSSKNAIQLLRTLPGSWLSNRKLTVAVRSAPFNDGTGPCRDEIVSEARDGDGDAPAFCVKQDDSTQPRVFERVGVDVHLR